MRQSAAILLDAYRELNARKMFWVAMVISLLIVACFMAVGITPKGIKILWFEIPALVNTEIVQPSSFYKFMFVNFGINVWLTWGATILALTSTSGLIPEFIRNGAIEMVLSRPVGRLRLFLLKYVAGLLFVVLQVLLFTVASFIVIGIRGSTWEWGLFLAIPIVVVFFSYLFAIQVLLGMLTRSSTASLLLTLVAWLVISGIHVAESAVLGMHLDNQSRLAVMNKDIEVRVADIAALGAAPNADQTALVRKTDALEHQKKLRAELTEDTQTSGNWQHALYNTKTVLPKLSETAALLSRHLMTEDDLLAFANAAMERNAARRNPARARAELAAKREQDTRPLWWVLGTSLAFEAFILTIAAWIFCRRDF